ncbi:MAG: transposase [Thermoguttaceae bacterium]|nr:transposase [Thermoguttaceae bacterium]
MFRRLVLRELYERSNEELERQIADNYTSRYSRAWIWESDVHDRSTINNFRNLLKEKLSCRRIIRRFQSPPYRARSPSPERSRRRRAVSQAFNPELFLTRRNARRRRAFTTRDNIKKEADQHMPICLGQSP